MARGGACSTVASEGSAMLKMPSRTLLAPGHAASLEAMTRWLHWAGPTPSRPSGLPQRLLTPPGGSAEKGLLEQRWKREAPFLEEERSGKQPLPLRRELCSLNEIVAWEHLERCQA